MQARSTKADVLTLSSPCTVVAIYQQGKLSPSAKALDKASTGAISAIVKAGDISGKCGETFLLRNVTGCKAERVLLVGFGKSGECSGDDFRRALQKTVAAIKTTGAKQAHCFIDEVAIDDRDSNWKAHKSVLLFAQALYQFDQMQSNA